MTSQKGFWIVTTLTALTVALTAALGVWQISRGQEREALGRAIAQAPLVTLRGHWMPEHIVYLDNRPMQGKAGFYVITPLYLPEQDIAIVVERGWAPRNFMQRKTLPPVQTPSGRVTITGRMVEAPARLFALNSQVEAGILRQNLNLEQYQEQVGHTLGAKTLRESGADTQGLSRRWDNPASRSAKNYGYAVQWFALSALILGLYLWFVWIKPKYLVRRKPVSHSHGARH